MKGTLTENILSSHIVDGDLRPGGEVGLRIDQTLTQDATGTMVYLQLEQIGIDRVQTELSVSYVDHNTLQTGFENADDHRYLQSVAAKFGIYFSRPGNGICHQVHLERFGVPGKTLLGSDSHTPTGGGLGMIAIGAGGLDVAVAMAGAPYYIAVPEVIGIRLTGELQPWVTAKDVILHILRELSVKGGVGRVVEYFGPGVASLSVPERATITNMGAELGATTSIFPSDDRTKEFMAAEGRDDDWRPLQADEEARYDHVLEIDLSTIEPLIACPHSPDNVVAVSDLEGEPVDQVCIGSCTNSSYKDLMTVAKMLEGETVNHATSLAISPGSRQVMTMMSESSGLRRLIAAGARVLEPACGPCIGMGQSPPSGGITLRSFNRNFEGRSGTADAGIYLASPQTCAAAALTGVFTDPRTLGQPPSVDVPDHFDVNDSMIIPPPEDTEEIEVYRGPNIKPAPVREPVQDELEFEVLLKVPDNITTDHISPAGAQYLPLRSNVPALAQHVFEGVDPTFAGRALQAGPGAIAGGENYGQGSSREHAAMAPLHLGIRAVLAVSFARIHEANLVNFGILPLVLNEADYEAINQGDTLKISGIREGIANRAMTVQNLTQHTSYEARLEITDRQVSILQSGGLLNYVKKQT
ncbi:MAG: aconitate hydratase [Armatimonadota bacterium]